MNTLLIYNDYLTPLRCVILEGDFERFNGVSINSGVYHPHAKEFTEMMFDNSSGEELIQGWTADVKKVLEDKNWDKVALAEFLP